MFGLKFRKLKEALPQLHILTFKRNVPPQLQIRLSAITIFFSSLQLQIRNFKEWNVALQLFIHTSAIDCRSTFKKKL
jgi:hypothetical protein